MTSERRTKLIRQALALTAKLFPGCLNCSEEEKMVRDHERHGEVFSVQPLKVKVGDIERKFWISAWYRGGNFFIYLWIGDEAVKNKELWQLGETWQNRVSKSVPGSNAEMRADRPHRLAASRGQPIVENN